MTLQNILTLNCTRCAVPVQSKKRLLELICQLAANELIDSNPTDLLDSLMNREKMGSTGIGNGIAIPHGRLNNTDKAIAVFLTTEQAIDFDAIDNRPVDIFICLFVPEGNTQAHLETLQSIAKLFSDRKTAKKVRKCTNQQEMFDLIQQTA
ncbi:PTS IIA-like nitrogen regulatory protein PtsN [Colwellia sp. 20A7]|jgi:PTS system nitrogen regulatory IIA component|uniref:PTS IIA-like nitrogen regulatory protein PtsN n=1 Tax=Colwellia sp. 20A7 TaxID=2689569 RepID=UPI0013588CAE|nr:PTS IIA-like nitrogen regulatory protein PtsN [Colwellia sp. 20A7]